MTDGTGIEWTDATWNPLRGCSRVSEGCRNCYAETVAARFSGPGQPYEGLAKWVTRLDGTREARWTGDVALIETALEQPLRWKRPRKIFVNSMSDLFHKSVQEAWIDRIFAVMALAPQHTFQILTKRPERMRDYLLTRNGMGNAHLCRAINAINRHLGNRHGALEMPLPNVWLGVSVEDQKTANERIPPLLETPAAVRWISAEPLLGPLNLRRWLTASWLDKDLDLPNQVLDWVVAGMESGLNARPGHPDWVRLLRDDCAIAGTAFLFKQWGEWASFYDRDRDDPDWRRCPKTDGQTGRGATRYLNLAGGHGFHGMRVIAIRNVGKKAAGRTLDGKLHDGYPVAK